MRVSALDPADINLAWEHLSDAERAELDEHLAEVIPDGLPEFFQVANPEYRHPEHLFAPGVDKDGKPSRSLGETLEATIRGRLEACFSTPPQFGKTILILAALLWYACKRPGSASAYVSYGDEPMAEKSDIARKMAETVGLKPKGPKSCLTLKNGSKIFFTYVNGPLESKAITGILALDDLYKSILEAESAAYRRTVREWFFSTALGRRHPTTSTIVIMHRWTADDLIGELSGEAEASGIDAPERQVWPWTNYPALWPDGRSLWESLKPAAYMREVQAQVGPFRWLSQYQGKPTAKGGRVFEGVYWYRSAAYTPPDAAAGETFRLPERHLLNIGIGVDLAYTEKTSSDWSVAVVLGEYDGHWYVIEALRRQVKADVFAIELERLYRKYPGAQMRWDGSSTEIGSAHLMTRFVKIPLQGVLAKGKPFDRAQDSGAAWRQGLILLPHPDDHPEHIEWLPEFARIVTSFIGGEDAEDDDVVALASGFALLPAKKIYRAPAYGTPEWVAAQTKKDQDAALARVRGALRQKERNAKWGRP
jgi:phage terminase large subunit-like protein